MSTKPPSPPLPGAESMQGAARGVLRDAVGGLQNLRQLLHSIRVGPKALVAVLPDVHASCAPLRSALRELLDAIASELPEPAAAEALRAYVEPRVQELEHALGNALGTPLNARGRLELESAVDRLSRELDAARELVDLLEDAVEGPTVRLSLLEIIRHAAAGEERAARKAPDSLCATLGATKEGLELLVNARVALALITFGANLVTRGDALAVPHVTVGRIEGGSRGLSVTGNALPGEKLTLQRRHLIEPTLPCLDVAARLAGGRLDYDAEHAAFAVIWPADG